MCDHFHSNYFIGVFKVSVCDGIGENESLSFIINSWNSCDNGRAEMKPRAGSGNPVPVYNHEGQNLGNYPVQCFSNVRV